MCRLQQVLPGPWFGMMIVVQARSRGHVPRLKNRSTIFIICNRQRQGDFRDTWGSHELNALIMCNKRILLSLIFKNCRRSAAKLCQRSPVASWRHSRHHRCVAHLVSEPDRSLSPALCLVPAGVLSFDQQRWISARTNYLFSKKALAKAFKQRYIKRLVGLYENGQLKFYGKSQILADKNTFGRMIRTLRKKKWIVEARAPFAGPGPVLQYLGRYTHRVAISNNRIVSMQKGAVTFTYRDRADNNKQKRMTLSATEFIRRFLLHVLPDGFVKIRYFGFLAHRNKKRCIALIRKLIDSKSEPILKRDETDAEMMLRLTGIDITSCPRCGKGKMVNVAPLAKIIVAL
jgi:hypothetical protein